MSLVGENITRPTLPIRILQCIPTMTGGGAERQLVYLCEGLTQLGWDVTVALLDLGPNVERLSRAGIHTEVLTHRTNYDPFLVWQLVDLIRRLRPDVVHTWLPTMNIIGGIAAGLSGTILIGSERNSKPECQAEWKDRLQMFVLSSWAAAVVANSTAGLEYLQTSLKGSVAKYVVPNGLPMAEIDAVLPASRQALGIEREGEVVLYAGRFDAQKNLSVLFNALPIVFRAHPQAVAILCGEGFMRGHWIDWAHQNGLAAKVFFPGYLHDLWAWMKSSDMFVFPSLFEGQPNVVLEAMVCQCPLVVSDIPEHREFLDEECALLVPPESPEKIAEAIIKTLDNRHLAALRAANAKNRVSLYTAEKMVQSYRDIYLRLLEARHTRM